MFFFRYRPGIVLLLLFTLIAEAGDKDPKGFPKPDRLETLRKTDRPSNETSHRLDSFTTDYIRLVWKDPMFYGAVGISGFGAWGLRRLARAQVDALNESVRHLKTTRSHIAEASKEFYQADRELKKAFDDFQSKTTSIKDLNQKVDKLKSAYDKWQSTAKMELDHLPKSHGLSLPRSLTSIESEIGSLDDQIAKRSSSVNSTRSLTRVEIKNHNKALSKFVKRSLFDTQTQLVKRGITVPGFSLSRWRVLKRPELLVLAYPFVDFGLWNYRMYLEREDRRSQARSQARLESRESFVNALVLSFQRPLLWTMTHLWRKDELLSKYPCPVHPALFEEDNVHLQTMADIMESALDELRRKSVPALSRSEDAKLQINRDFYVAVTTELIERSNPALLDLLRKGELVEVIDRVANGAMHFYEATNEWVDGLIVDLGNTTLRLIAETWENDESLMLYPFPLGLSEEESSLPLEEQNKILNHKKKLFRELNSDSLAELYQLRIQEEATGVADQTTDPLKKFYGRLIPKIILLEPSLKQLVETSGEILIQPIMDRFISVLMGTEVPDVMDTEAGGVTPFLLKQIDVSPDPR